MNESCHAYYLSAIADLDPPNESLAHTIYTSMYMHASWYTHTHACESCHPYYLNAIAGIDPIKESLTHTVHMRDAGVTVSFQFFRFDLHLGVCAWVREREKVCVCERVCVLQCVAVKVCVCERVCAYV